MFLILKALFLYDVYQYIADKDLTLYADNIYGSWASYFQTNAGITEDLFLKAFGHTQINLYVLNLFNNVYELRAVSYTHLTLPTNREV